MKIFGNILIVIGAGIFIYSFFVPTSIKKENSNEQNIQALGNFNFITMGLIFLIVGVLSRQGIWKY